MVKKREKPSFLWSTTKKGSSEIFFSKIVILGGFSDN